MKFLFYLIFGISLTCFAHSQGTTGRQSYFAIGLFTSAHSGLITYATVTFQNGKCVGAQILTEQRFMYEILGYYPSIANPERKNLLYENGVDSCFLIRNDADKVVGYYCKPFYDLWRIRFYEHPMEFDNRGWSQGRTTPARWQREYLYSEYGVSNVLFDYFYGDSLYRLLRDVQNPEWVDEYRYMQPDTTSITNN